MVYTLFVTSQQTVDCLFNYCFSLSFYPILRLQEPKRENALAHGIGTQNMLDMTPHAGRKPYNSIFDWGVYFPYIAQATRSKQFCYPQVSAFIVRGRMQFLYYCRILAGFQLSTK